MARRTTDTTPLEPSAPGPTPAAGDDLDARVLIVSGKRVVRERLAAALAGRATEACVVKDARQAEAALEDTPFDLVLIDGSMAGACGLTSALCASYPEAVTIMLDDRPTTESAIDAMRAGAADVVPTRLGAQELVERLRAPAARARRLRQREARIRRLRRLCHTLNSARLEVTGQVGSLCNDLVEAYRDLSDQMSSLSVATELNSLLRQELDIESLLRTLLEFVLAKAGSTNAAVFLPASSGDFSLGAYVNYDCPKDTAEVLLDHLANVLAPRFDEQEQVLSLVGEMELAPYMGEEAHWLADSAVMVVACRHEDECLAVLTLFRDRRSPYSEATARLLQIVAELFGSQLARVIKIHHRHLPRDQWGGIGEADDDLGDIDLAA